MDLRLPVSDKTGCPTKPLKIKCTSMGIPSATSAYWCIVAQDGHQFYFDVSSWRQAQLISDQAGDYARRARDAEEAAKAS